jgi:hypothetical protein
MTTRSRLALDDVAEQLHRFDDRPLRVEFLSRSIATLSRIAERLDADELDRAIASTSNAATLLTGLIQPSVLDLFDSDPLAAARLRGLKAREELLAEGGGTLSAKEVSALLRMSRQAVDKRRMSGNLLAIEAGRRGYRYPAWQFTNGDVVPGLGEILSLLAQSPPLAQMRFFLSGSHKLGGKRPLDRMKVGDLEAVRRAARTFGEQGAA